MTPTCSDWQLPVSGLGQASSRARQENRAPDFWVSFSGGIAERLPTLSQASEHVPGPSGRPLHLSDGRALLKRTRNDPPRPRDMALHLTMRATTTSRIVFPPSRNSLP